MSDVRLYLGDEGLLETGKETKYLKTIYRHD